jgi:hypothetical protein
MLPANWSWRACWSGLQLLAERMLRLKKKGRLRGAFLLTGQKRLGRVVPYYGQQFRFQATVTLVRALAVVPYYTTESVGSAGGLHALQRRQDLIDRRLENPHVPVSPRLDDRITCSAFGL